jgi:hypothetical protein
MLRLMGTKNKKDCKMKTMKITNMITMKTIYILAALLGLQFNTIFAAVSYNTSTVLPNEAFADVSAAMLMPAIPVQAIFEDVAEVHSALDNLSTLMPVIPMIADFDDGAPATEISLLNLAPVTPAEADFEDETGVDSASSLMDLAPVTPLEADFEDHV